MKFPVTVTPGHQGESLDIDPSREIISLHGANGALLGAVSWHDVIERIARAHARAPLAVKVKYTTPEGKQFDSLTGGVGGGGLFIESSQPLAPGTELSIEFALPDRPWEKHKAKAKVAWTRNKPERFLLFPGMGVQFTDIEEKSRHDLVELVAALNRSRATT
jgi:uncharacterized protein (TIGR02266 family)